MPPTISCVVPCYNEAQRVHRVLRVLTRIHAFAEIICVDDGSTDGTAAVIRQRFPSVRILHFAQNRGKAATVEAAAQQATGEYVFLVDADLQKPVKKEFETAVRVVQKEPAINMLVLRRVGKDWLTRSLRGDLLISGERIVRKAALLDLFRQTKVVGFQLEVALNQYMLEHSKNVRWSPISSTGVLSLKKLGFLPGVRKEIRMFGQIFGYLGLRRLVWQMLAFGRQRA